MARLTPEEKKQQEEYYLKYHQDSMKNWRAWGSWFSWGSPVGLALFYAIVLTATGFFIWLMHHL